MSVLATRILTAVVLIGCAMLGTAGAYGYRTYYSGASAASGAPPVITAEKTPAKIIPTVTDPQSGKSMMLRTMVMSMALTHTPQEVQFYALDLGGDTLASLRGLPHVGGVASRLDPDLTRRMVAEISSLITDREHRFRHLLP